MAASRIVFERGGKVIHNAHAADGEDARDLAIMILGRFSELEAGDQLTIAREAGRRRSTADVQGDYS